MMLLGFIFVLVSPAVSFALAKVFMCLYEKEKKKECC